MVRLGAVPFWWETQAPSLNIARSQRGDGPCHLWRSQYPGWYFTSNTVSPPKNGGAGALGARLPNHP